MKYHFKIYKEKLGYSATCIELKGCNTQGGSLKELRENMEEALNLYLSEPMTSQLIFSPPRKKIKGKNIIQVDVEPSVAIANRIRETRLKNNLTQVMMRNFLGINNLSSYQRLEDPTRSNPEFKTLMLIKSKFPQFKVDDLLK